MAIDKLVEEYKGTHPKSGELHERAVEVFAAAGGQEIPLQPPP